MKIKDGEAMKRLASKKLVTIIIVLALLLLIPAGTLLAGSLKNPKGHDTSESTLATEGTEAPETEESEEEPQGSEQALAVAERIAAAEALGLPPGHLNIIDRLIAIAAQSGMVLTREELLPILQGEEGSVQQVMKEIKRYRFEAKGKEIPGNPPVLPDQMDEDTDGETGRHGKGLAKGHNKNQA